MMLGELPVGIVNIPVVEDITIQPHTKCIAVEVVEERRVNQNKNSLYHFRYREIEIYADIAWVRVSTTC